jgi:uncharacterized membrane protein YwaF
MAGAFQHFGAAHLAAIILTFVMPLGLCAVNGLADGRLSLAIPWLLAALIIISEILKFVLLYRDSELTIETAAPMHLCNWAAIATLLTLIYPNQRTYELCYFWALGGYPSSAADARSFV